MAKLSSSFIYGLGSDSSYADPLGRRREEEEDGFFGQDTIASFGIGTGNLVGMAGTLYGLVSGNMDNRISRLGEQTREFYEDFQTEELRQRKADFQALVDSGEGELEKAGLAVAGMVMDPALTYSYLVEQVPLLVGSGGAGLAARGGVGAIKAATPRIAGMAGTATGIGTGAALNAADISKGMYDDVMSLPQEILDANPEYRARATQIGNDAAREEMALDGARNTAYAVGALSAVTAGVLPGTVEKTILGARLGGKSRTGNFLRGFGAESLQEAIEEGGGQFLANLNLQGIDPSQTLSEGVGQATAQGGLLGGLMGGSTGFLSNPIQEAQEQSAREGGDNLDQAAAGAQSAARAPETLRERMNLNRGSVDATRLPTEQTTIETPTSTTVVETDSPQAALDLQQKMQETSDRRLADLEELEGTSAENPIPAPGEPITPIPFDPLITPIEFEPQDFRITFISDLRRDLSRALVLANRDQRAAERAGDQQTADEIESDIGRLRLAQSRLKEAQDMITGDEDIAGSDEAVARIIENARQTVQTDQAARQAFDYVNVLEGQFIPRVDENLQTLKDLGVVPDVELITYRPPTNFEVDSEGTAARPGGDRELFAQYEEEQDLELVNEFRQELTDEYEDLDPTVLREEADRLDRKLKELNTRRTGTAASIDDDVLTFITKKGGINIDEANAQGLDTADNPGRGRLSLFRREGGLTMDGVAEVLTEAGFMQRGGDTYEAGIGDANTALEIVANALNAYGQGNLTFFNGKEAEIEQTYRELSIVEEALLDIEQTLGSPLTIEDELLLRRQIGDLYNETYGKPNRADSARIRRAQGQAQTPPGDIDVTSADRARISGADAIPRPTASRGQQPSQGDSQAQPRDENDPNSLTGLRQSLTSRLQPKLMNMTAAELNTIAKDAGLPTSGNKQKKVNRLISFRIAADYLNTFDTLEDALESPMSDSDKRILAGILLDTTSNTTGSAAQWNSNLSAVYFSVRQARGTKIPQYRPETQAARDVQEEQLSAARAVENNRIKLYDNVIGAWLQTETKNIVMEEWANATPAERLQIFEDASEWRVDTGISQTLEAARAFGQGESDRQIARRTNTSDLERLPKHVRLSLLEYYAFTRPNNSTEYQAALTAYNAVANNQQTDQPVDQTQEASDNIPPGEELTVLDLPPETGEAQQPSQAPEHRAADRGISKAELDEMAESFRSYMEYMKTGEGSQVTRIFEEPAKEDVVRLKRKVDRYVSRNGYMDNKTAKETVGTWKKNAVDQGVDPQMRAINGNKVVLSLFDLTGSWSRPWAEAGYEVYTFDIQDDEFMGDINNFSTDFFKDNFSDFEGKEVYAILAATPCTDFASSGARHFAAKDADGRTYASVQLVKQTLATIEYFKPQIWAIENPVGRIGNMTGLPEWRLAFDPYHLGEDYTKKTILWGRFNGDLPIAPTEPTAGSKMHNKYGGKSLATKNARSETPEGFAYAFFEANNQIDNPVMSAQNRFDMADPSLIQDAIEAGATEADIMAVIDDLYYQEQNYEEADRALSRADFSDVEGQPLPENPNTPRSPSLQPYNPPSGVSYNQERDRLVEEQGIDFDALENAKRNGADAAERLRAHKPNPELWSPFGFLPDQQGENNENFADLGRITWNNNPGAERTKAKPEVDYNIGTPQRVEGRPGVWAREIRDPKGNLAGVVESSRDQSVALYLDEAGSYDVVGITPDSEMGFGGNTYPDSWHQRGAIYKVIARDLRARNLEGAPTLPAPEFTGRNEQPLLESYTEEELRDRDLAIADLDLAEQQAQVDREREFFDLDAPSESIDGTNDPLQSDDNQQTLLRRQDTEEDLEAARQDARDRMRNIRDRMRGRNQALQEIEARRVQGRIEFDERERGLADAFGLEYPPQKVLSTDEINTVVDRVLANNKAARDRVTVVRMLDDLPESVRRTIDPNVDPSTIGALVQDGNIYIIGTKMRSPARVERAILHEGTHIGVMGLYRDQGVRKALNKMFVEMGGSRGFNTLVDQFGIREQISPYLEDMAGTGMDPERRNMIIVNEMLAYVAEQAESSESTLKESLIRSFREVVGAIRAWFRNNGLLTLSRLRASDIAYTAKRAREEFLNNQQATAGPTLLRIDENRETAQRTGMGLYSNAEQVLLDEGQKIFKTSKKNPEGTVKGDQILSFLKARGLKKDENEFTQLEEFLTTPQDGVIPRYTREQVIAHLRSKRPEFRIRETTAESYYETEEVGDAKFDWSTVRIDDDPSNWEYVTEDAMGGYDDFAIENALPEVLDRIDGADNETDFLSGKTADDVVEFLRSEGRDQLPGNLDETFADVVNEQAMRAYYDNDPTLFTDMDLDTINQDEFGQAYFDRNIGYKARITGNDDYGWTVQMTIPKFVDGEFKNVDQEPISEQNLEEAKLIAYNAIAENGVEMFYSGTSARFLEHFRDLEEENSAWDVYKEYAIELLNNRFGDYTGGHFGQNTLIDIIVTERESDELGKGSHLEETQSDLFSTARRLEGFRDEGFDKDIEQAKGVEQTTRYKEVTRELRREARQLANILAESDAFLEMVNTREGIKNIEVALFGASRGVSYASDGMQSATYEVSEIIKHASDAFYYMFTAIEPRLTAKGKREIYEISNRAVPRLDSGEFVPPTETGAVESAGVVQKSQRHRDALIEFLADEDNFVVPTKYRFYPKLTREKRKSMLSDLAFDIEQDSSPAGPIDEGRVDFNYAPVKQIMAQIMAQDGPLESEIEQFYSGAIENKGAEMAATVRVLDTIQLNRARPPKAPFGDNRYFDLAVKQFIAEAISKGKDYVAVSTADRVSRRWGDGNNYSFYDRQIAKTFEKILGVKPVPMSVQTASQNSVETDPDALAEWKAGLLRYDFIAFPISDEVRERIQDEGLPMYRREAQRGGTIYPALGVEERLTDKAIRLFQDKLLPLYRVQQALEAKNARKLDIAENPYLTEELFYGKTEEDLRQIEERMINPLMKAMSEYGVTSDQLNDYLYAKHAKERNDYIAETQPNFEGTGSGMTEEEANEILGQYKEGTKEYSNMEDLAGRVYEMTQLTRDLLTAGGLVSDDVTSSWQEQYEFYVPLRGFADNEVDENNRRIATGRGFDIRGKETKRAYGRNSRAQGPLAQVIADLTGKVIRNRKNEVGQAFLRMVENNPDPMFWEVFSESNPDPVLRRAGGNRTMAQSDEYFAVKRDGEIFYIKVKDKLLLNAMQNVGPEQMGAFLRIVGGATRFLSSVNTAYDPQFVVTNFARDIQAAYINLAGEETQAGGLIEGEQIAFNAAKNTPKAIAAIAKYKRARKTDGSGTEYEQYFQEFLDSGAKTGYFDSPDLNKLEKDLAAKITQGDSFMGKGRAAASWVGDFVNDYNLAVENGVRLSAYVEARKAGVSREIAASLAKNMTVNFNRKGSLGPAINSLYMFFNAAIQGTRQFVRTLSPVETNAAGQTRLRNRMSKSQKIAAGLVGVAYLAAQWNRWMGGEDDDGESYYDKINPAIRERNFIIMKPDGSGEYYKWPLPYGYNFFYTVGTTIEAFQNGSPRRNENLLGEMAQAFVTSFSPISLHANATISAVPSVAVPVAELWSNTNFFGSDIVRENFPTGPQRSNAHNYWNSTKDVYVGIAQFMNDTIGGGSEYRKGSLGFMFDISTDVSPDALEHIAEYALGGIYRTATGGVDSFARLTSEREVDLTRAPFLSKLLGRNDSDFGDQSRFYDSRQLILNARKESQDATGAERREVNEANNQLHRLYPLMNNTEKFLRAQRDRRDRIRDDESLSEAEREDLLLAVRERMDDRIDRFNKKYEEHLRLYAPGR